MKENLNTKVYPIILRKQPDGFYLVIVPDFDYETQGTSISNSIEMARDLIGMLAIEFFKKGKKIPESGSRAINEEADDIKTLVDVNLQEYFRLYDNTLVKKTLSIPNGLNERAMKENINFSKVLTDALYKILLPSGRKI